MSAAARVRCAASAASTTTAVAGRHARSAKTTRLRIAALRRSPARIPALLDDGRADPNRAAAISFATRCRRTIAAIELRRLTRARSAGPVNRLAKAIPSVRGSFARARNPAASGIIEPTRVPCRRAEIPARQLLNSALLLIEGRMSHAGRLHPAGETLRSRLRESSAHRAIGQS